MVEWWSTTLVLKIPCFVAMKKGSDEGQRTEYVVEIENKGNMCNRCSLFNQADTT